MMMKRVLLGSMFTMAAGDRSASCSADFSVFGYSSIDDLNQDIMLEFASIQNGTAQPKDSYVYNLCPHTVFRDGEAILPLLNNSHFICGNGGNSHDKCTIAGGNTQVKIVDYPDANMEFLSFRGITFSDSEEHGVAAHARSGMVAEFVDCHWVDGHGTSGIHIEHQEYVDETEDPDGVKVYVAPGLGADQQTFKEDEDQSGNVFEHRQLAEQVTGMSVHIYNSTMSNIHQDGFRAIYSSGQLLLFNVTMRNNQAGVLINIINGNATIDDCRFESMDAVSLIRVVNSPMVTIRGTSFVENRAVGMVTAIGSHVSISKCEFRGNYAPRGGEVLAFSSDVVFQDSCIYESTAMTSVFRSSTSRMMATNIYGQDLTGDHCPGILVEDEGSDCFSVGSCDGRCEEFSSTECTIPSLTNAKMSPSSGSLYRPLPSAVFICAFSALFL